MKEQQMTYKLNSLKLAFLFFFSLLLSGYNAQTKIERIDVIWGDNQKKSIDNFDYFLPFIIGQDYDSYLPHFTKKMKVSSSSNFNVILSNKSLIEASSADLDFFAAFKIEVPTEIEIKFKTTKGRNANYLVIDFFPFVKENNVVYRITSLNLDLQEFSNNNYANKDYASQSVLSDAGSEFYKISVKTDGIYKIDKIWLESNGINTSSLNPNHFNIYGNGEGKLPELNSVYRTDDLAKNAIKFVGDGDNLFEADEYFIFYAWGANKWNFSSSYFRRDLNIYSEDSYYFIRISESDAPSRINQVVSTNQLEQTIVSDFDHYDIYENDLKNLTGGGQRWYGELFDTELSRSFSFSIPNLKTSEKIKFFGSLASNAKSGGNTIDIALNANTIFNAAFPSSATDYRRLDFDFEATSSSETNVINITFNRTSPSIVSYLDKIELNCRRNLIFSGSQFRFRDSKSVASGMISKFEISNAQSTYFVWDISDRHEPKIIEGVFSAGKLTFNVNTDTLREFVCSNGSTFNAPSFVGRINNQNLHGLAPASLLIVTHPLFLSEATRLAQIHISEGTSTHIVTTEQVYNEFSSGMVDPTAIKTFAKMFYDRANGDVSKMPENLLLFGDGTYDPKNRVSGNNYYIPTFQTQGLNSEDHISNLVTDDYFGMLDDNESLDNSDMMDLGVGRMIVSSEEQAKEQVDKIVQYLKRGINEAAVSNCGSGDSDCSSYGDWRLKCVQIADDEENGYFINVDTEPQYESIRMNHPEMNLEKIYLDAYSQVTNAGGERYPDVFDAITDRVQRGSLIVNYVGHGGEVGVAEERVITIPQIQSWSNMCNLNLFVSATCEFTKFDDPARVSAGEWVYLNPTGGAIALMTTTRSVFFGVNSITGEKFFDNVFKRDLNNQSLTFGEIMRRTKNEAGSSTNKRSFTLIGDPALRIALPEYKVVIDSINSFSPSLFQDTLEALSKVRIKGRVVDYSNNTLQDFNGILTPSIFDKIKIAQTLGQNEKSPVIQFETQKNVLYKGKSSVKNGTFDFSFIVPKDINYSFGNGKISLYANSENLDAGGNENKVIIGGISEAGLNDNIGPEISLFLNEETFIDGGLTNESPILIAKVFDENGINTVGNGIGHDVTAIIDGETSNPIILNDYYNADLDTYQSGSLRYNLTNLDPGEHSLTLKVWDVNNNSSESTINFEVRLSEEFALDHVLNYPNPFTTNTSFFFEHNQACNALEVQIQIFTVSGKLVKTINQAVYNECFRSDGIAWDGRDDFGDQLAKGVYIYNLSVTNAENQKASKIEKLVLLK
jgi:hypothetical protein